MGSGTIIDASGLIVTVNYVVIGASSVEVTLGDGRTVPAALVARDYASGLALLKVPGDGHVPAALRSSATLQAGEEVFLLASVGEEGPRVGTGMVSYIGPFDAYWEYFLERAIMATVMSPGVGGGPMFDAGGRMVGIVSLNLNEVGRLSLAIPVENYMEHRDELLRYGGRRKGSGRAWVGFYCHTLQEHVVILGVLPGAPGETAGLRAGDVVLAVDGSPVSDRRSLYQRLWSRRAGDRVAFQIFRQNEVRTIEIATVSIEEMFG
jgi:S1-C subfamily serine protease